MTGVCHGLMCGARWSRVCIPEQRECHSQRYLVRNTRPGSYFYTLCVSFLFPSLFFFFLLSSFFLNSTHNVSIYCNSLRLNACTALRLLLLLSNLKELFYNNQSILIVKKMSQTNVLPVILYRLLCGQFSARSLSNSENLTIEKC